ncbi:hypothetical protein SH2C18_19930 [Clostridium sediminicola]|uniref:hypothetical protein n=1 Tax=Clostridium sediminicola TaxID=3114879 RepID=UPI0031F1D209
MNNEIARQRYKDVFLPDVIDNSKGDFLAKHVPMKNLFFTDHDELLENDKKHSLSEEQLYEMIFSQHDEDQFVLVKGASGAGKSHLIRWFDYMLEIHKPDSEIILYIRRADNTLKGTIRQLLDLEQVKNLPNKDLYKKLASASTTVPELELKNTIYYGFVNLIESDDGKAGNGEERFISNVNRKHLVTLLQNSTFKDRLMESGGPIDRIYTKIAENKTFEINDKAAQFEDVDFEVDSKFRTELISVGADNKARKIADKLLDNPEFVSKIVIYVNKFVEKVIQRCTGLEPGDLRAVIEEIRQELHKQGCTLTVLIEDITAASGVDDSLLDALLTNKKGYSDKKLCRINSIVGVADGYYRDNFRTNTKGRIKQFIIVPDEMFNGDTDGLVEFFARYLNTVSLDNDTINSWVKEKANPDLYPIHEVTLGKGWDYYELGDKMVNLFPFSKRAIVFLYRIQDITQRNPRAIMRNLIEPYVKDALDNLENYPVKRTTLEGINPKLQNKIYNQIDLDDNTKIRLSHFMYIWGDGTDNIFVDKGIRYIAGIQESVYEEIGLPIIDGKTVSKPKIVPKVEKLVPKDKKSNSSTSSILENEQVSIALKEVDKWIEDKEYKLSIGATTKNVKALNDARKNINEYLFNVIDWISEGVSIDAMHKIRNKYLVAFERQTMESDAVILLSASIESRKIIEAFVRWNEVGKKSWDFPNSTDYLYRVQRWTNAIKPQIIDSVINYKGKAINYFSYAVAAEYYRLILNGYCKNFQSPNNFNTEMLLNQNEAVIEEGGHTKTWKDLQKITSTKDGVDNRNCILQYYNLPQGNVKASTNYEFDYVEFNKAVRKVINTGLIFEDEDLQLDDPVRKRRLTSEYLKKILDRVDTVVEDELKTISEKMGIIKSMIEVDDIEDIEDIKDIVRDINKFYNQAQISHISVAVHVDTILIKNCQKNAGSILNALKVADEVQKLENSVEALIKLSRDPLAGLSLFVKLIEQVKKDVMKANQEIEIRMKNKSTGQGEEITEYVNERDKIVYCKTVIEEVKKRNVR